MASLEVLPFLALALALGFKHSYDADHIVAVSNLLTRTRNLRRATTLSAWWAAGHMVTASVITVAIYLIGRDLIVPLFENFDLAVALMLIAIGVVGLLWEFGLGEPVRAAVRRAFGLHEHPHGHRLFAFVRRLLRIHNHSEDSTDATHRHAHVHFRRFEDHETMLGIGIVHGLASNDELIYLLVGAFGVSTLSEVVAGVGVFSLGVVAGMIVFAVGLSYPMARWGDAKVRRVVNVVAASLSIVFGAYLLLGGKVFNLIPVG